MFIDFTNRDNLLFLGIVIILVAVVIFILVLVVYEIVKIIKKLFHIGKKKPETIQKESAAPAQLHASAENNNLPKHKIADNSVGINLNNDKKNLEVKNIDIVKEQKEKDEKDVAESLSNLKSGSSDAKQTLESKMPSRTEKPEANDFKEIKIPRPEHFLESVAQASDGPERYDVAGAVKEEIQLPVSKTQAQVSDKSAASIVASQSEHELPGQKPMENKNNDSSIFHGKSEVSRIKLSYALRKDAKVWQASKQVGLNMSPVERAKLVKQVFSSAYGGNISKTDLKQGLKKLNQKMLGAKDAGEHAKIRKEIKFFKKIGGV